MFAAILYKNYKYMYLLKLILCMLLYLQNKINDDNEFLK